MAIKSMPLINPKSQELNASIAFNASISSYISIYIRVSHVHYKAVKNEL